jgi:hypothetical protein
MNIWESIELFLLSVPDAVWVLVAMALYLSVFAHKAVITIKEFKPTE